jgi:hypothetical protein
MKNKKLAKEILQMTKVDQKIRKAFLNDASLAKELEKIDISNLKRLKKIIKKFGWPTIQLVGKRESNLALLLIQHADHDLKFQKFCLRLMIKEAKRGNVLWENVAYLTDRVLVNSDKPQLYGTQFYDRERELIPREILDISNLNKRRKRMGLEPFEKYKKKLIKYKRNTKR